MNRKMDTFFKISKGAKELSFGLKTPKNFNYIDFGTPPQTYLGNSAALNKQMHDSYILHIEKDSSYTDQIIPELKLTNQEILTWEDYWIDSETGNLIDPKIEKINLQKNHLIHANFNVRRSYLKYLNLEGNVNMRALFITDAPNLEVLNISNCPWLQVINLGNNRNIKALLARNCDLSSVEQERLLRDFRPTITSSSNTKFNLFRKSYSTVVDLRGSEIDWGNRKVASKVRLLLCNNWLVLWDNTPPASVIPPHMYAFFTNNLEEKLIKDYYK